MKIMKPKKNQFWLLAMLLMTFLFAMSAKAQVTIGSLEAPKPFSVLELISNDKGLRLPQLTTGERNALGITSATQGAEGLVIYNTDDDCLEFWNGNEWISLCADVLHPCDPPPFTPDPSQYAEFIIGVDADGNGVASTAGLTKTLRVMKHNLGANPALSVKDQMAYSGRPYDITVYGGFYQWGRNDIGHTFRCDRRPASDAGYFVAGPLASGATAAGRFVTNSTSPTDWITPQTPTLWGSGGEISGNGNVPNRTANDPCPAGWRVPTQQEWGLLLNATSARANTTGDVFSPTSGNNIYLRRGDTYWVRVVNGYATGSFAANSMCGYALYEQSEWENAQSTTPQYAAGAAPLYATGAPQPLLFLPAAGNRSYISGAVVNVGTFGFYGSSSYNSTTLAYNLHFGSTIVDAGNSSVRAVGFSVRCIEEVAP